MPREIWSEGRVVGLSSYEIYVKQHLAEDPNTPPASEREWLASSIAMGSSMILKVPNVNQGSKQHRYVDIFLPTNSKLAAANTIVAQFFDGECEFNGDWAVRVTDYGQLISNTSASSPNGYVDSTGTVPAQTLGEWSQNKKDKLKDYVRIYDGVVIQPGTWVNSSVKPPEKDFEADLGSVYARIRLHVRGSISHNPYILLTGFTIRSVLAGVVGNDTVTESASPQDGDFLGPAVFPWAAKIAFVVPNSYITYFDGGAYQRDLEAPTLYQGSTSTTNPKVEKLIQDTAVIDMQASKPETFYNDYASYYTLYTDSNNNTNPRHDYNVDEFVTLGDAPTDGAAVLTVYQKRDCYPPALYGTFVNSDGTHYLNPIDVVAPGTIKMFNEQNATTIQNYEDTFPGTSGMNRTSDGTIQVLNVSNKLVQIADIVDATMPVTSPDGTAVNVKVIQMNAGKKSGWALAMSDQIATGNTDGTPKAPTAIAISQKPSTSITLNNSNSDDNISWSALLHALTQNKAIDLLGTRLKSAKVTLVNASPYLEFGPENSKKRLYIATSAPATANVPEGSIGIGWGLNY